MIFKPNQLSTLATASLTFADVAATVEAGSNQQLRAWTQLRLQRHITFPAGDVKAIRPLCESASGAALSHVVRDCLAAGRIGDWGERSVS